MLLGGAAINRAFVNRALYVNGKEDDTVYEAGAFYCKDAFEGLAVMDQLVEDEPRQALMEKTFAAAEAQRNKVEVVEDLPPTHRHLRAFAVRTDNPIPEPPFWGVREIEVDMDELYRHLDTHVLFKLHWGGRGIKGEAWTKLVEGDVDPDGTPIEGFRPKLERMWKEQTYLHPRALLASSPATPMATTSSCSTPRTARPSSRASSPRVSRRAIAWRPPTSSARRTPTARRRPSSTWWPCRR